MNINSTIFSVIIPTHNRDLLLVNALESVLNQAYKPLEIIVVDDNSSYKTEAYVENISKKFNFNITYLQSDSDNGVSHSYNLGSRHASGEFLAFLDDDDYWHKEYLNTVYRRIIEKNVDIVITMLTEFDENNEFRQGKIPPDVFNIEDFYLKNPGILRSNFVVRREKFNRVGGYDETIYGSSDKDIFIRLMRQGCRYDVIKEQLVFWRTSHDDQASTNPGRMVRQVILFYKKYFKEIPVMYHIKMCWKISKLYIKSKLNRRV